MPAKRPCPWMLPVSLILVALSVPNLAPAQELAEKIFAETQVQGGFVIQVGCGDGKLTAALRPNDRYQVHGVDTSADNIKLARRYLQKNSEYGPVAVDQFDGKHLPYTDEMANLLVAESLGDVALDEVLRVLVPGGVAYYQRDGKWVKTVKPWPEEIDHWTHYFHGADGNPVANDTKVAPPRHLKWLGSPRWSRHHDRMASMSALVSDKGRMFYIIDEGSRISIQMPSHWKLVARDAFNGVILWKRDVPHWYHHLWPLKSGPTQLARRLVTDGDTVYVTLGFQAPLTAIDAATGETKQTYENTLATEEVVLVDGILYLLVNKKSSELQDYTPKFNTGDQGRVFKEFTWNEQPREIVAVEAASGKELWRSPAKVAPLTLTADGKRVMYHDGERAVCLNPADGKQKWASQPIERRASIPFNFGPRLVSVDDVLVFAGGDRKMTALNAETGEQLWSEPHARGGYQSPEDLIVINGVIWSAPTTAGKDSGAWTGRDLRTGKVKIEFPPDVDTYWFHHRCYIAKATSNFIIPSRTGVEFVDPKAETWTIQHWVRGGCLYGVMPCNGLLYTPPHDCACYPEAKLFGFNALAPDSESRTLPRNIPEKGRLQRGPAYGKAIEDATAESDWPTFRHDNERTGHTKETVPNELTPVWNAKLGGRLSAPVVANGRVFISQVDAHTVHALDAKSGRIDWSFTTGGRVDSPPTIYQGRALFGSADGWVYCVRANDGELIWRYRAAPLDQRLMSFEQLESVWPVHGTVLVQDDIAYTIAGRSNFLDGGLRLYRLNPKTGEKLTEKVIDDIDPDTGKNIQDRLQVLNMPVGLSDILSSDGSYVFLRSQKMDLDGNRHEIGPVSGDPVKQVETQRGPGEHLFAPMGYLDDSYFHRAYWVYGRAYAGGHSGYSKAGKFAPAGRLLVSDKERVYGFGRKPEYFKWTTTMEHMLFAAKKDAPLVVDSPASRRPAPKAAPKKAPPKKAAAKPGAKKAPAKKKADPNRPQHVAFDWANPIGVYARAMVLAGPNVLVAGPPDLINEEDTFKRIMARDTKVDAELARQDAALDGAEGGRLVHVSIADGKQVAETKLDFLPVWDGMAATGGRLYVATTDGRLVCLGSN